MFSSPDVEVGRSATRRYSKRLTLFDATLLWEMFNSPAKSTSISESMEASNHFGAAEDRLAVEVGSKTMTPCTESAMTTLCTTAFSLVLESNRKGNSAKELDLKLRVEYKFSAIPLNGCRVDNNVLFEVLAEFL
jgi:hypothetical protein